MRLLVVNRCGHRIGGIEVHLQDLVPALLRRGHEVFFLHGDPVPPGHEPVVGPGVPSQAVEGAPSDRVLEWVGTFRPEVLYVHEPLAPTVLGALVDAWPSAWFAHAYYGACISGSKCWKWPVARPCSRKLDLGCLLHFLPHRCGGLNPVTMLRLFRQQRAMQVVLRRFDRVGTHSEPMRREYLRQGLEADRVRVLPFPVRGAPGARRRPADRIGEGALRLLYLGRFDALKGGRMAVGSLPELVRRLGRPVVLTLAGEGPERPVWEAAAQRVRVAEPRVGVEFAGWVGGEERLRVLAEADVLVVPSVWPEPFGMTGVEAGFHGVPAVAFEVGGVRAWLEPGVNGELAPGDPPTVQGLVDAVVRAVGDAGHYRRLSAGALERAGRFTMDRHLDALEPFLQEAKDRRRASPHFLGFSRAREAVS